MMVERVRRQVVLAVLAATATMGGLWLGEPPVVGPLTTKVGEHTTLPVGSMCPDFGTKRQGGGMVRRADLIGKRFVLVFVSPNCPYCRDLEAALGKERVGEPDRVVFISREAPVTAEETGVAARVPWAIDSAGALFEAFGIVAVPTTVSVTASGRVQSVSLGPDDGIESIRLVDAQVLDGGGDS